MRYLLIVLSLSLSALRLPAHPGHSDPELAELNDYLMAIQIMRVDDPKAREIFSNWQELRTESWRIRELTDEKGLSIQSDEVQGQLTKTRALRKRLLTQCRDYFDLLASTTAIIEVQLGEQLQVEPARLELQVPVNDTRIVLLRVQNDTEKSVEVTISGQPNDHIRFWNKRFPVSPSAHRYTYVQCSPLTQNSFEQRLEVSDNLGRSFEVGIQLTGVKSVHLPYTLEPGDNIYKVKLPSGREVSQSMDRAEGGIQFNITDDQGSPAAARIEVRDEQGNAYWAPLAGPSYGLGRSEGSYSTTLWEHQPGPYFYVGGRASLDVEPNGKTARIYRGFEFLPQPVQIPKDGKVKVSLKRWINMAELGWYSGHTHIHTTDAGMPVQFTPNWAMLAQAEGLNVSAILTLKGEWETHAIYAGEFPTGVVKSRSTPHHIIFYGEEYRNNPYGHLALLGLDYLLQPISSGALGELGGPDYPANAQILEQALEDGATTIGAHFGNFITRGEPIKAPWPSTGFEMPVDVALERIQLAEIYGVGGQTEVWYDFLNCGFKIPATAGPDWSVRDAPRVYVNLEGQEFSLNAWLQNLEKGRSFVTRGPMLFFTANDLLAGSEITAKEGPVDVQVTSKALVPDGQLPVEIVYNGEVVASGTDLDQTIRLDDSGWIAARCDGAHSNPVYVNVAGRPAGLAGPAEKYLGITDLLVEWVNTKGLFDTPQQKEEVLTILESGRAVFHEIANRARDLGRE